jgi:hypothetical protein
LPFAGAAAVVERDGAFEASGLIGTFEVAGNGGAVLLQFDVFRGATAIGTLRVNSPFSGDVFPAASRLAVAAPKRQRRRLSKEKRRRVWVT